MTQGRLYVVATPIGNLADMTFRAVEVLKTVDLIAAEDTRHSHHLLQHYGIATAVVAFHEHNERNVAPALVERLCAGESMALISDAGTPLIRDPGFPLLQLACEAGIEIVPVPGCCALIAALSASGLPSDRFSFAGFPPRTEAARRRFFESRKESTDTLVFYESSHRIIECLADLAAVFPGERVLVVGRELTKRYETFVRTTAGAAVASLLADPNGQKGEFVVLVQGRAETLKGERLEPEHARVLGILLDSSSLKSAVNLAAKITGAQKRALYQEALRLTGK